MTYQNKLYLEDWDHFGQGLYVVIWLGLRYVRVFFNDYKSFHDNFIFVGPLDVVKSQIQSGKYNGHYLTLLKDIVTKGLLFRGILPGMTRSFVANGISMVAYDKTEYFLKSLKKSE